MVNISQLSYTRQSNDTEIRHTTHPWEYGVMEYDRFT